MIENTNQLGDLLNFEQELCKEKAPKTVEQNNLTFLIDDLEFLDEEASLGQVRQKSIERAGISYFD